MSTTTEEDLLEAAREEMERACTLGWTQLNGCTPWGDVYEGFTPSGRRAMFKRNYLWAEEPGGDILLEVVVYESAPTYDQGARLQRHIRQGASGCD